WPALLLFLTLALALACFLLATRRDLPRILVRHPQVARAARLFIYPLLLWAALTSYQTVGILARGTATSLTTTHVSYGSDDLYYNQFNAVLVLRGENPYTGPWLRAASAYFHTLAYTPLRLGRFSDPRHYPTQAELDAVFAAYLANPHANPPEVDPATTHSYPAGAFLVDVPFVWAGVPSVAFEQILLLLALLAAVIAVTPPRWRIVVALLVFATADGARAVTGADFEIWPLALVAFAWLTRYRRWPSALLLGAACSIKQTAWIAAPFYLLWVWRTYGRAEAIRRGAVALAAFLVINLPWIIASPGAWLSSLLLPISLPLLPDGSGIIGLSLTGILPLAPSWVYGLLELAALSGGLVWYWRTWPHYPFAGLILPLVPLFFAWRSSERYFELLPVVAVLAAVLTLRMASASARAEARGEAQQAAQAVSGAPAGM
ncbi:MAG TPA: hypothetical protein VKT52_06880, partial [Ktedonobacterales bacterium]|nr:hypothetical protein [Ktedonobacterales bacterium]